MFGFFIAGLSALGLIALARRRHHGTPTAWALNRLNATAAQEKIIREASHEARAATRELRQDLRESRGEVADLLTQEQWDDSRVDAWLGARKAAFDKVKPRLVAALREVHETLDSEQRAKLSRFIERAGHRHHGCAHQVCARSC